MARCAVDFLPLPSRTSAGPPVVLETAPLPCSHVPSCLRPRRKQDPIVVALMFALLVVVEQVGRQQPFEMPLIQDDHVAAK